LKLSDNGSKELIKRAVSREKEVIEEFLESILGKEVKADFDLNGVTVKLGKIKLKLNGSVEVTVIPPKKG